MCRDNSHYKLIYLLFLWTLLGTSKDDATISSTRVRVVNKSIIRIFLNILLTTSVFACTCRWLDYRSTGTPIRGTQLLPVKLPIPSGKSADIPKGSWFTDIDLVNHCAQLGSPLTAVIDLTNTRYYHSNVSARPFIYVALFSFSPTATSGIRKYSSRDMPYHHRELSNSRLHFIL